MAVLADACPIVASCAARDRWLASAPAQLEQVLTGNQVVHDINVYPAPDMASSPPCPGETPIWPLVASKFADTGWTVRRPTADSNDVNISVGTLIPSGQPQASGR